MFTRAGLKWNRAALLPIGASDSPGLARLGRVNEDPWLDLSAFDNTTFFRRGMVPAPWCIATDGVGFARAVDLSAQEDARQFRWTGQGKFTVEGPPINLARQAGAGALVLD